MHQILKIFKDSLASMRKVYGMLCILMVLCLGCQWQLKPSSVDTDEQRVCIQRYDRIESLYLTTGDYSALQQMNTIYPTQTRMLIEDVLRLGRVNDRDINSKFLCYFQDSTLQAMLEEVQRQYADMDDINKELSSAFKRLKKELPDMEIPEVYTQIGSFDQSIVVDNHTLGISLDKYLGADYPFYIDHYTAEQRAMMVRSMIVPDCLSFYLLSLYPLPAKHQSKQARDQHMVKIQWVVNQMMRQQVFISDKVNAVSHLMKSTSSLNIDRLLRCAE